MQWLCCSRRAKFASTEAAPVRGAWSCWTGWRWWTSGESEAWSACWETRHYWGDARDGERLRTRLLGATVVDSTADHGVAAMPRRPWCGEGRKGCFGESEDGVCSAGRLVGYVIGPGLRWQLLGGRGGGRELAVLSCRMGDGGDGR